MERQSVNRNRFQAPTPGQQGTVNVSTRLPDGIPVATGLFPAGGPVAQALGATPLKPELSNSFTIGLTGSIGEMDLTVDYYRIDIDDRTNAISTRAVSTDPTSGSAYANYQALDAAGVLALTRLVVFSTSPMHSTAVPKVLTL